MREYSRITVRMYTRDNGSRNKQLIIIIAVIVFLTSLALVAAYTLLQKQEGELKIVSSPSSTVFINNAPQTNTPFATKLKPGEYLIKLIPTKESTTAASWQSKVMVYKNAQTYINRVLGATDSLSSGEILSVVKMTKKPEKKETGEIYVETDPAGALVYLNSDEKGVAPHVLENVPVGEHELSVYLPNFVRRNIKVIVTEGYRINASIKLAVNEQEREAALNEATAQASLTVTPTPTSKEKTSPPPTPTPTKKAAPKNIPPGGFLLRISNTPTGFLRVREDANTNSNEIGRLKPGDEVVGLGMDEDEEWYKIQFTANEVGWISAQYAKKIE